MKNRVLAAIIAVSVLFSGWMIPAFATENSDGTIDRFDSFGDYEAARGAGLPDGWSLTNGRLTSPGVSSFQDTDRRGTVMKVEGENAPGVLFGSIFSSGKLHISFDVKQVGDSNFPDTTYIKSLRLDINGDPYLDDGNTKKDTTIDDPTVFSTANGYGHNLFETMNVATEPEENQFITGFEWAHRWKGTRRVSEKKFVPEEWHKLEFYIDKDNANQNVYTYMDGELIQFYNGSEKRNICFANSDITTKLKGMVLTIVKRQMESGDTGGFLFDNVYLKSYSSDDVYTDGVAITVDDGAGTGIARQNGVLNVGFSEYMSRPVTAEDVTVTSFLTGEPVTNYTIENADPMQFDICFDDSELAAGKYTVSVNNVVGNVSGLPVKNSVEFRTQVAEINGVQVPWVDGCSFVTFDGTETDGRKPISTATDQIKVKFSAPVSQEDLQNKITLIENQNLFPYETITMEDANCTAVLHLNIYFTPDTEYTVIVDESICAEGTVDVPILSGYAMNFRTLDDGMVCVTNKTYRTTGRGAGRRGVLELDVLKTTIQKERYTLFVTAHTEMYDSVLDKTVKKTVVLGGDAIVFDAGERMVKTGSVTVPIAELGDAPLQYYLISYPDSVCIDKGKAQ